MKPFFFILFVIIQPAIGQQNDGYMLSKEVRISSPAKVLLTDPLGNIYLLTGTKLIKRDASTQEQLEYSNLALGEITSVDVSDPFKILLFYQRQNQVIFLNNKLAPIGSPVKLDDLGHEDVELVCSSGREGFWIYERMQGQLFHYNNSLKQVHQSISLKSIVDDKMRPAYMTEENDQLYLNIPDFGILVFNQFGGYMYTIPLINVDRFQVAGNNVYYLSDHMLIEYNPIVKNSRNIPLPDTSDVLDAGISRDLLFLLKKDSYKIYKSNNIK